MLQVIGIGPGQIEWLPAAIFEVVRKCEVLVGGNRALNLFPDFEGKTVRIGGNMAQTMNAIRDCLVQSECIGILVSGDPGFFSLLPSLQREFPDEKIISYPGISSMQMAFARAGLPWQEAQFASVHGRSLTSLPLETKDCPLAVLTGGVNTPQEVAKYLEQNGCRRRVAVGNALGYPEEFWQVMKSEELVSCQEKLSNALMIIYPETGDESLIGQDAGVAGSRRTLAHTGTQGTLTFPPGIPDGYFHRGNVPMTKQEIRVQILAKARIRPENRILDVGAGTGSISIEAAALAPQGKVYAVEVNPEAIALIHANKQKFDAQNLEIIPGMAPEAFAGLEPVDVCIIGGSKGNLAAILEKMPLVSGGSLVLTAVTLETVSQALSELKQGEFRDVDVVSIQAVRWNEVGHLHMAQSLNPVFILSARKK